MTRENTPKIDVEELLRQVRPIIRTVGLGIGAVLAVGKIIQARTNSTVNSLTFEEQLLTRHGQLIDIGLTEEQARVTLNQSIENILAKGINTNQQEEQGGTK